MNEKEKTMKVVEKPAVPAWLLKMRERRPYVTRPDAPAVHARLCCAADSDKDFCLNFNGVDILTMRFPEGQKPSLRVVSDGDYQSTPMIQQFAMWLELDADMQVEFFAPVEMWNMRPRRAVDGEAILGQNGYPLMYGVNGLYLPDWDFLMSWQGVPFDWNEKRIVRDEKGWRASMTLHAGNTPWVVELRPRYYSEHLGYRHYKPWEFRPNPKAVTGWCSWEAYHTDVTQADIEMTAEALRDLRDYGLEYMQLDDGYQQKLVPMTEDGNISDSWLTTNGKFEKGHEGIVSAMRGGGFKPGVWTNATVTNREAAEKQDFCLRDANGQLICGDWIQYPLDMLPATLEKHIYPYYRKFRELGYEYVKSDSLRHVIYDGMQEAVRLGVVEPEEARARFRAYMETARRGLGDDVYYLSCWGVLSESIGVCDAMRVGTDANPQFGSYSMQLRETARWFHAQRVLFTVDPDHVCVRGEEKWVRMILSLVSLSGGLMMVSDKVEAYSADKVTLMQKTMPALATRTAETGPVDYKSPACVRMSGITADEESRKISHITDTDCPFASLWATHFDVGGGLWTAVARTAEVALSDTAIPLQKLALDPKKRYCAYDFWNGTVRFVEDGVLRMSALETGDAAIVALTDITDGKPQVVGSDRHVSADAVSIEKRDNDNGRLALKLRGFPELTVTYALYLNGLLGKVTDARGIDYKLDEKDGLAFLKVEFKDDHAEITIE